jgi:hypothetical protein
MKASIRFGFILLFAVFTAVEIKSQDLKPTLFEIEWTSFRLVSSDDPQVQIGTVPLSLRKVDYPLYGNPLVGSSLTFPDAPPLPQSITYSSARVNLLTGRLWFFEMVGFGVGLRTGKPENYTFGEATGSYHGNWGYYWDAGYWFKVDSKPNWLRLLIEVKTPPLKIEPSDGGSSFSELSVFAGYEPNIYSVSLSSVKECYWWGSYQTISELSTTTVDAWYAGISFQVGNKGYYGKSSNERGGLRLYFANEMASHEFTPAGKAAKMDFSWKSSFAIYLGIYCIY